MRGEQVSLRDHDGTRADQANWTSCPCSYGPKRFRSSWISISQNIQTDTLDGFLTIIVATTYWHTGTKTRAITTGVMLYLLMGWWRHQMEIFFALLAICAGNSSVTGDFPAQRPVTRSFDVFFDLRLNEVLSKQSWGWWFETLSRPLWRRSNELSVSAYNCNGHVRVCRVSKRLVDCCIQRTEGMRGNDDQGRRGES